MKKALKKIIVALLTIIAAVAFILCTAEADTSLTQFLLTGGCMAAIYICYRLLDKIGVFSEPDIF